MAYPHWITCQKCGNRYSDYGAEAGVRVECVPCRVREFPYKDQVVNFVLADPEFADVLALYVKVRDETREVRERRAAEAEIARLEEERKRRVQAIEQEIDRRVRRLRGERT